MLFQITLDGDCKTHNKIKHIEGQDTFNRTIENIHSISNRIRKSYVWIRINYDGNTLDNIDNILPFLNDLDRKRTFLILRKIWQIDTENISSKQLLGAIQKILNNKFFVDCYALSRSSICLQNV